MEYVLRENPRARRINITVRRDGTVLVTKPRRVPLREVQAFVHKCEAWIERTQERFARLPRTSKVEPSKKEYEKYKAQALRFARERVAYFNTRYQNRVAKIVIRNQKSRWGSCSAKGVLSFNYRLLFLPPHLADYIVVHELCHLREMNHSKRFWQLVALAIPDHLDRRKRLRERERGLLVDL